MNDKEIKALFKKALKKATKAAEKYPQPNYTVAKVSEEVGEFVQAVIHYAEGRADFDKIIEEAVDSFAMMIRTLREGDATIGFVPEPDASPNNELSKTIWLMNPDCPSTSPMACKVTPVEHAIITRVQRRTADAR